MVCNMSGVHKSFMVRMCIFCTDEFANVRFLSCSLWKHKVVHRGLVRIEFMKNLNMLKAYLM